MTDEHEEDPSPEMLDALAVNRVCGVLLEFGVCTLSLQTRRQKAEALVRDGAGPADVETCCAYLERTAGHDLERTVQLCVSMVERGTWRAVLKAAKAADERMDRHSDREPGETTRQEDQQGARAEGVTFEEAMQLRRLDKARADALQLTLDEYEALGVDEQATRLRGLPPDQVEALSARRWLAANPLPERRTRGRGRARR